MKKGKPVESVGLTDEVKEMEQRLEELKGFMQQERQKRATEPRFKDGSRWRSGSGNVPNSGYDERVLNYEKNQGKKIAPVGAQKRSKESATRKTQ